MRKMDAAERWKINLYAVWISQVLSLMSFGFGLPFLPFYIQELGITSAADVKFWSGILNAAPAITMAIMAPVWGIISDKYGRKLMLMRAMFFAAFIIGGMGLVTNVNQLMIFRLLQGIFTGTVTAATILIAANTPKHKIAFALGFLSSSTYIGQSIGPVIGGLISEFVGYRVSFLIGGILMFLDFLLVLFFVKEEKGSSLKSESEKPDSTKASRKASMAPLFTAATISMLIILLFMRIGRTAFSPYLPIFVQEIMNTTKGVAGTTGVINGFLSFATALSGFTLSKLGDKHDKIKLLGIYLVLGAIMSLPLAYISNLWLFSFVLGIVFFITGGVEPMLMAITAEHTPVNRRGLIFGIQGTVGNIGFAIAPLLGGAISLQYSTTAVLWCIPLFIALSAAVILLPKLIGAESK
ncbi:MAG: MFS transporter [Clostridiaceae bacterium]